MALTDTTHETIPAADSLLTRATADLRGRQDDRWVEIQDRVLSRVMSATRRSQPVRAETSNQEADGQTHVSEAVLIAHLAAALDDIPESSVDHLVIATDHANNYTGLTIVVRGRFGHVIIPLADQLRHRAESVLTTLLGNANPSITVTGMHVHVDDVQRNDPKLS